MFGCDPDRPRIVARTSRFSFLNSVWERTCVRNSVARLSQRTRAPSDETEFRRHLRSQTEFRNEGNPEQGARHRLLRGREPANLQSERIAIAAKLPGQFVDFDQPRSYSNCRAMGSGIRVAPFLL